MYMADTNDPQHWRDRAAQMRALAVKMAGTQAATILRSTMTDWPIKLRSNLSRRQTERGGKQCRFRWVPID
jgi:hypothetical protein